jgi:predicted NAD/FAD-binding protein
MRIAIVGSGISGLVAAHTLGPRHEVVLFEADRRPGGHTHTIDVPTETGTMPVDTGFIVFNKKTYPSFCRLLDGLGVRAQGSDMSFSARSDTRDFEYSGTGLNGLYAQRRHFFSARFHRMVRDIFRFYREARELLASPSEVALEPYLRARGYSEAFIADHLLPLTAAVWSSNRRGARGFPARFLVRFFDNHGFLQVRNPPQWLTVRGGSRQYVRAILDQFNGEIRTNSPVESVSRTATGVLVKARGQDADRFGHVVIACHADQALRLVSEPTRAESEVLSRFSFQTNHVVLHSDPALMPRLRRTWSSWNYHLDDDWTDGAAVTYWMNRLQSLSAPRQYFVTLNRTAGIRPEHTIAGMTYSHPVFTPSALEAQAEHDALINHQGVSYCGAYWRNGFHEDGVVSALRSCAHLGATL